MISKIELKQWIYRAMVITNFLTLFHVQILCSAFFITVTGSTLYF